MKEDPSIKTKIFTDNANHFIVHNITLKTGQFINTLKIGYTNSKSQQEIIDSLEKNHIKAFTQQPTNCVVTENILQTLKVLKDNAYISLRFANEIREYYTTQNPGMRFSNMLFNQTKSPKGVKTNIESKANTIASKLV